MLYCSVQYDNDISQVHAPGANQLTFAAEHTFLELLFEISDFSTPGERVQPSDIKTGELAGRTSRRATPATNAQIDRGFILFKKTCHPFVVMIVINRCINLNCITEVFRHIANSQFR